VRAWQLVPQIGRTRRVRGDFMMGFHFLVTGFFLKMVVANNIAKAIDPYWIEGNFLSPLERWIVAFLYYCQIYGDFAGYSLMALGMARLLGYRLPANFRSPMLAASIQEFWQRWHITLSRWLRDYLYIPMGGNRVSPLRSALNVMATMLLGGLWHGAGWGFVFWGGMHGTGIVAERFLGFHRKGRGLAARLAGRLFAQLWIIVAWVFFRSPDLSSATHFIWKMLQLTAPHDFRVHPLIGIYLLYALPVIAHHLFPLLMQVVGRNRLGIVLGASTGVMLLLNIIIFSPTAVFIYFRF
jgi:alginate O-acetyltransferase complex protein AlgI